MAYYRYRPRYGALRLRLGEKLGLAIGAGLMLASFRVGSDVGHHVGHALDPGATVGAVPAGGSYTPQTWAGTFLDVIGEPRTRCNLAAITAWEAAEGGAWNNSAAYNPLNTTYDDLGAWEASGKVTATINSAGVRAFDSWATGLQANAIVIQMPAYAGIRSALSAGNNAQAVADAVAASPWGTNSFSAGC